MNEMIRLLVITICCLLSSIPSFGQDKAKSDDAERFFCDSVSCDGHKIPMIFRCHPKVEDRAIVGYSQYGHPSIDTLTVGRIVLPDSVTDSKGRRRQVWSLGRQAFANCRYITEVVMPDSLKEIGDQAFYGCTSLREVTLPPALSVIYPFAFRACPNLNLVIAKTTRMFGFYDNIFDQQTYEHATLVVPAGIFEIYANSLVFGMFRYKTEAFE